MNSIMKGTTTINCGQCIVQKLGRIAIQKVLTNNGIKEGDTVDVFIKKVTEDPIEDMTHCR